MFTCCKTNGSKNKSVSKLTCLNPFNLYSSLLNKNEKKIAQKCFGSRTWVHKKTFWSSSCIPNFDQNKNELKIKTKVKLYSQKIKL